jgi:hypothetical protein
MNNIFQEKRSAFILLVGLLFVLLIVIYFAFLKPFTDELKGKESSSLDLQDEIARLEKEMSRLDDIENELAIEQISLQKKIPLTEELEKLVLTLGEIELVSLSHIETIEFHYDGSLPTTDFLVETEADNEAASDEETEHSTEANPAIDFSEKPASLEIITIRMDVVSPTYEDFLHFITEIEKQERIMSISRLQFEKPGEEELIIAEESNEAIIYNVELITFYYTGK